MTIYNKKGSIEGKVCAPERGQIKENITQGGLCEASVKCPIYKEDDTNAKKIQN